MSEQQVDPDMFQKMGLFTKRYYRDTYSAIDTRSTLKDSQEGKVIIVSGASRGIGPAFAQSFAQAGAKGLALIASSEKNLEATIALVKKTNPKVEVLPLGFDMTDEKSVLGAFEKIKEKFGSADVLINNAGAFANHDAVHDFEAKTWWRDVEINILGTALLTRSFLKLVGTSKPATIVNMSSAIAFGIFPGTSAYHLGKLANHQLAAYVAAESPNVTAVSLQPGIVPTDMVTDAFKPFAHDTARLSGDVGVWLATGDKAYLSGRHISANWDVEDLEARKKEIVDGKRLQVALTGDFGPQNLQ